MKLSMMCATAALVAMVAGVSAQSGSQAASGRNAQMATKPAESGPVTLANELRKDWANQKETMMAIADAMPAEKFGYKPTPAQRSFGEQILHVAGANVMIMKMIDPSATAPAIDQKATSKTAILKALSDSYDFGEAALKSQTDQSVQQVVNDAPRYLGPSTRARLVYQTMIHAEDEYGAMTVYLRLNDIVPPASRRGGM